MIKSNIKVKSNIYPRKGLLSNDREFVKRINNKKSLEKLNRYISFSKERDLSYVQKDIYENELIKCYYNEEGDITYGLLLVDGELKWGCRCEEIDCKNFKTCRPNISEVEIEEIIRRKVEHLERLDRLESIKIEEYKIIESRKRIEDRFNRESIKVVSMIESTLGETETLDIENDTTNELKIDLLEEVKIESSKIEDEINELAEEIAASFEIEHIEDLCGQENIINAHYNEKILVDAPPGTGKTYTLIERIKNLVLEQDIETDEIMVLSFSRAAISEINNRVKESSSDNWDLNRIDIRTFDSFATYLIREIEEDLDSNLYKRNYDERIEYAIRIIEEYPDIFLNIKHLIVDEIQDLVGVRARLVKVILTNLHCGFTLLGDMCQSIYDYQVKDIEGEMDSKTFNKWLVDKYEDSIKTDTLDINYRQTRELWNKTFTLRDAIMNKPEFYQLELTKKIINGFNHYGKTTSINEKDLLSSEKTAILCRNNGQALKVSKDLSHQGIVHNLQKASTHRLFMPWLALVLNYDDTLRINEEYFLEIIKNTKLQIENPNMYWEILKNIEGDRGSYIDVELLCSNFPYKGINYDSIIINNDSNLVVSTIHKSKGKEYDKVIILDEEILQDIENLSDRVLSDEVKVYYVALTRSKEKIKRLNLSSRLYASKKTYNENRWVSTVYNRFNKKVKISELEVGKEGDIDIFSFVSNELFDSDENISKNQEYIMNNINKNDKIQLRLDRDDNLYYIYHLGNKIGRMSKEFYRSIYKVHGYFGDGDKYMPDEINDIYIDEICSYVGYDNYNRIGSKYERKKIWLGISIVGFGSKKTYFSY